MSRNAPTGPELVMVTDESLTPHPKAGGGRRALVVEVLALLALVLVSHFTRLELVPVMGEEGRRARSAINMIETGDWVVVTNQGVVFPDRPPMTNWLMAVAGQLRGSVDTLAIRLPSAFGVLATALLLYGYCRRLGSRFEALVAPAIFVTSGQVLQLGRLGESEAVFVFFVAASLLVWHLGFTLGRSPALTWSLGYALAALGALTKGLQAPVYFVAVTAVFLLWRRQWRWLFGRGHWIGAGVFCAIVLAWLLPYYLATDWAAVVGTWFDVVGPRLTPDDLLTHVATFPLEIAVALLPWSLVGGLALSPAVRAELTGQEAGAKGGRLAFLLVALAVTFPTVWFSAGAKTRYYMPLYPLLAVLGAMVVAACATAAADTPAGRTWSRSLVVAAAAVLLLTAVVPTSWVAGDASLAELRPPTAWAIAIVLAGLAAMAVTWAARKRPATRSATAILLVATFLALLHSGSVVSQLARRRQDAAPVVAQLRASLPAPVKLVSFGPIHTKFLYFWGELVPETPWPRTLDELPTHVDYFAFDRRPGDTAQSRTATRGMVTWTTPGSLPFRWRQIATIDCGRKPMTPPDTEVVIGRVLRDAGGNPLPAER